MACKRGALEFTAESFGAGFHWSAPSVSCEELFASIAPMSRNEDALRYHREGRPGKIEVVWTKPVASQLDLSLAYSPGVAAPCLEIAKDPDAVDLYTARRNLVGVVTNGTAVLGLGNIGPRAAKPVMEGKAVLFKRFADIDVFDIEVDEIDPEKFITIVRALEPTFGAINLEDIRAPDCFVIERALRKQMKIPVFHDDQHGTAIITAAAVRNAAELQDKPMDTLRVTCVGAGAAATSCMEMWVRMGVRREHITLVDVGGVLYQDRGDIDEFRAAFARPKSDGRRTLGRSHGRRRRDDRPVRGRRRERRDAEDDGQTSRSSSRSPTPIRRSATPRRFRCARTRSSRLAAVIFRIRSTTCSAFRTSSAARSTYAPPR